MPIESSGHSRGNPRLYELVENAPKTGKSPTVWAWPQLIDYLKVAGQPVAGPWPPHQEPRPDPEEDVLPVAVPDTQAPERPARPAATPRSERDPAPGRHPAEPPGPGTPAAGVPAARYGRRTTGRRPDLTGGFMYPSRFHYEAPRSLGEAIERAA